MSQNRKQIRLLPVDTIDKTFKQYAKTISQSIQKLGAFTDNLQSKVNTLLKAQQTEFVTSYKIHMGKIKTQLQEMDKKICQYQQKIQFYQNQGRLSHYIKKVNFMEFEQIKLFQQIQTKDKKIKDLQFEIEMFKKLQKFSDDKIKTMIRNKVQERQKQSQIEQQKQSLQKQYSQSNLSVNQVHMKQMSSIQTFATQIPSYNYYRRGRGNITSLKGKIEQSHSKEKKQFKLITQDQQKSILYKSQNISNIQIDERQTDMIPEMKSYQVSVMEKEISQLKAQNKKLLMFNSKYASNLSELGQFFLKTVQELKRSVISKRKLKENTTFADFCKQDKLVLIATLLSNQSALMLLYDSIFKPQKNKKRAQSVLQKNNIKEFSIPQNQQTIQEIMMNPQKSVQYVSKIAFPSIKSKRLVY